MSETEQQGGKPTQTAEASGSIIDQIIDETEGRASDDDKTVVRGGLSEFVTELIRSTDTEEVKVNRDAVDRIIEALDAKIGRQVDAILHDPEFRELESAWRGLKYLVDNTEYREGNRTEILDVSKEELAMDFEDAPETLESGLYFHVYETAIGNLGSHPYGAMVANYQFDSSSNDIELLRKIASVASMAHCPFISAASPNMLKLESFEGLRKIKHVGDVFDKSAFAKWNGFREEEDAKYIGLTMPRFMLRPPYSQDYGRVRQFNYVEDINDDVESICWGNAAFAFAAWVNESFAKFGWCPNIIGPASGGAVKDLPVYKVERSGNKSPIEPTEVLIPDRLELELSSHGFIPLVMRKDSDNAVFFSAHSVQRPKEFNDTPEGKAAELNMRLSCELPYMFIITRLSHFLKVMQRENVGSWTTRAELELRLNEWIRQYKTDQDNPPAEVRSRKPLRQARVAVEDFPGHPGWYTVQLDVQPHMKYQGADFTLSLRGKLDATDR